MIYKIGTIGFSLKAAKGLGGIGAGVGLLHGALKPEPGESRVSSALKDSLSAGLLLALSGGLITGQIVKGGKNAVESLKASGDKAVDYLNKTMNVI